MIGSFDGKRFQPETESKKLQYSHGSYAAQTWSGIPVEDGRRIRIAWNRFDIPSMPYNMSMDFPCEMKLRTFSGEAFLCAYSVREIEGIYGKSFNAQNIRVSPSEKYCRLLTEKLYDIMFDISCVQKGRFRITLYGVEIYGDLRKNKLVCLENTAPLEGFNENVELRMLIDVNNIEIFINKGKAFMSIGHIQDYNMNKLVFEAFDNEILLRRVKIVELKNIWKS